MSYRKIFTFLLFANVIIACSNDNDGLDIICTEEVSFEKNGVQTTFEVTEIDKERKAEFVLMDTSYNNPSSLSRIFTFTIQDSLKALFFDLQVNVDDANSCIPIGLYDVNTFDYTEGRLIFTYVNGINLYKNDFGAGAGSVEITDCDFEHKQISGRFDVRLVRINSDSIIITNGVFENVCFVE